MPKWIERWITRISSIIPECTITCEYVPLRFAYLVKIKFKTGYWKGILLRANPSPAVGQNRKWFKKSFDDGLLHMYKQETTREKRRENGHLSQSGIP